MAKIQTLDDLARKELVQRHKSSVHNILSQNNIPARKSLLLIILYGIIRHKGGESYVSINKNTIPKDILTKVSIQLKRSKESINEELELYQRLSGKNKINVSNINKDVYGNFSTIKNKIENRTYHKDYAHSFLELGASPLGAIVNAYSKYDAL